MPDKKIQIKETLSATKQRHKSMTCVTREIKVAANKMSKAQKDDVNTLFREAKWYRNYALSDIDNVNDKTKSVPVKVGEDVEQRDITVLGSQIKQSIIAELKSAMKSLATAKAKGRKIGKLQYKSVCNCVTLKQYGRTYRIDFEKKTISVQGIKKAFKVNGLSQIPADAEIACAKFVRKASGLFFYVTYYIEKVAHQTTGRDAGLDFGIKDNLITSDGKKYNICVSEDKSIKRLSRKTNRGYVRNGRNKKTKNHGKRIYKLKRAYEKNANRKKDRANKLVSELLHNYDNIVIQDEMIHNWHSGLFGKQVQYSAIGVIKAKLKSNSRTVVIEKSFPSTQLCPKCGCLTKHDLSQREYTCQHCGYHHGDRDVKAAETILHEGLKRLTS